MDELLQLLDSGDIGRVDFLYSVYFKSNERQSCERLTHELTTRGHRVVAMLTHAKVLLVELTDGRGFTVESSANLRSCASIEQITMTQDADLTAFHRKWIDEILTEATTMKGRTPKPTQLKRLAGTLRKNRQNLDEPMPEAGTPEPPADLDARARAAWDYYAPILSGCRLLTLADREMLACFCAAAGRRSQAEEELAKSWPRGQERPAATRFKIRGFRYANKALEQLLRFGQELGLHPASRTRVKSLPAAQATTGRKRFFKTVG